MGAWTLPGGGIEAGEGPAECCVREVAEETGYHVRVLDLLHVGHHWIGPERRESPNGDRAMLALQVIYRAEIIGGEFAVEVGGSTDDADWVPLESLDEYAGPGGWPVTMVRRALQG